jgi:hypothetical protein
MGIPNWVSAAVSISGVVLEKLVLKTFLLTLFARVFKGSTII